MSDVEWDADDFDPEVVVKPTKPSDKWEGEDEDDDVKDNWDDEEEKNDENKSETASTATTVMKKKKKKIEDILAEKEAKKKAEMERKKAESEEKLRNMSPSERVAEKMRIQKIQEEADLSLATDLVGDSEPVAVAEITALDDLSIEDQNSLDTFRNALVKKLRTIEKRGYYVNFVEVLAKELLNNVDSDDVKKVTGTLNALYNEKVKASKPVKGKKKGAGKAKLNVGMGAINDDLAGDGGLDEYEDFI